MCSPSIAIVSISKHLQEKNKPLHIYPREILKRIPQEEEEKEVEGEWGKRGRRNDFELVIKKNFPEKHSLKRYPTKISARYQAGQQ